MEQLTKDTMIKALDTAYEKVINGIPGTMNANELANDYLSKTVSPQKAAEELVKWQIMKCGTSGFITGLGGIITLPVAIPANIASVLYVQIRMIAAVGAIGGYDLRDDRVKSLVYICMCGNGAKDITKNIGIQFGTKMSKSMINKITGASLTKINQKVGFRLITKFGTKGVVNLGKAIPLVGGVIGGGIDIVSTKVISKVAISTFIGL